MDEENRKLNDDGQESYPRSDYDLTEQRQYEFYRKGITEPKGWRDIIAALIRNAHGRCLITVVAVLALCKIACEFIGKGSNNLSYKSITGSLLIALMIFITGLVSLRRVEGTDDEQKEKREKDKNKSAESGPGGSGPSQDRRTSGGDGGSNLDGSDK